MDQNLRSAVRIETKVLPGNKIEVELPPDTHLNAVGQVVEVILILPESPTPAADRSILEILEEIHSRRPSGRSVEEINRDLQAERDAWDG